MSNIRDVTVSDDPEFKYETGADEVKEWHLSDEDSPGDPPLIEDEILEEDDDPGVALESLDDDVELWPNGPTAGQAKSWKNEFGSIYVTSVTPEKHYIWRSIKRIEYKQIVKNGERLIEAEQIDDSGVQFWTEEEITQLCLLYPKLTRSELSMDMAGLPSLLSQEILESSGFVALQVRQL